VKLGFFITVVLYWGWAWVNFLGPAPFMVNWRKNRDRLPGIKKRIADIEKKIALRQKHRDYDSRLHEQIVRRFK
jgi:hypothetical protein